MLLRRPYDESNACVDDTALQGSIDGEGPDIPGGQIANEDGFVLRLPRIEDILKVDENPEVAEPFLCNQSGDPG